MTEPDFLRGEAEAYEAALRESRRDPAVRKLLFDNYLDEDLAAASARYAASDEFGQVKALLGGPAEGNARLLDCGGGRGVTARALAEAGFRVTLCDANGGRAGGLEAARALRRNGAAFDMAQADWEALPFPSGGFDIVFCRAALHHAEDIARTLTELGRVLRPGGRLLTVNDHSLARKSDLPEFLRNHPFTPFGVAENAHTLDDYRRAFQRAGLRILRATDLVSDEALLAPYRTPATLKHKLLSPLMKIPPLKSVWLEWVRRKNIRRGYPGKLISFLAAKP